MALPAGRGLGDGRRGADDHDDDDDDDDSAVVHTAVQQLHRQRAPQCTHVVDRHHQNRNVLTMMTMTTIPWRHFER